MWANWGNCIYYAALVAAWILLTAGQMRPVPQAAMYSLEGDYLLVDFDRDTLQGAKPLDFNNDGVGDRDCPTPHPTFPTYAPTVPPPTTEYCCGPSPAPTTLTTTSTMDIWNCPPIMDYERHHNNSEEIWDCAEIFTLETVDMLGHYPQTRCMWLTMARLKVIFEAVGEINPGDFLELRPRTVYPMSYVGWFTMDDATGVVELIPPYPLQSPVLKIEGWMNNLGMEGTTIDVSKTTNMGGKGSYEWIKVPGRWDVPNPGDMCSAGTDRIFEPNMLAQLEKTFEDATRENYKAFDIRRNVEPQSLLYMTIRVTSRWGLTDELTLLFTNSTRNCQDIPSSAPTPLPTVSPTPPTISPTSEPTLNPTYKPTHTPTIAPTESPTEVPTTEAPTSMTAVPTPLPGGTHWPTLAPTEVPTTEPSSSPTGQPTEPTLAPTEVPTFYPPGFSADPTGAPTGPTLLPTVGPPTTSPTPLPTWRPVYAWGRTDGAVRRWSGSNLHWFLVFGAGLMRFVCRPVLLSR
jgi:hypothetical protein